MLAHIVLHAPSLSLPRKRGRGRRGPSTAGERRHHQRGIGAGVTDVGADEHFHSCRSDALIDDFAPGLVRQSAAHALDRRQR
jgi:hypothetical protein